MFYDKNYALAKPRRKRVLLSGFKGFDETKASRNLPCDYVDCAYNFKFKNGILINPLGISALEVDETAIPPIPSVEGKKRLFVTKADLDGQLKTAFALSHRGGLEYTVCGESQWKHIETDGIFDVGVNYLYEDKDLLLLSGEKGLKALADGELVDVQADARILDMCVHYERIYAVVEGKRNSLKFSDDFDPYNWNVSLEEGGYINFDGSLGSVNTVKSFENYLYIFCDYGIYRLTAFADQTQFSMKKVYASGGKIFADSVKECGEYIAFASQDGIYLFDGYAVTKINVGVDGLFDGGFKDASACYAHGRYIMSFTDEKECDYGVFSQSRANNTILILDIAEKSVEFMRGISLYDLKTVGAYGEGKVIGLSQDCDAPVQLDGSGLYFGAPYQKYWQSGEIDFDRPSIFKVVRAVEYSTCCQYVLGIMANGERREFILSPTENRVNLYVKSDKFVFYIRSDNMREEIRPPILEIDFLQ